MRHRASHRSAAQSLAQQVRPSDDSTSCTAGSPPHTAARPRPAPGAAIGVARGHCMHMQIPARLAMRDGDGSSTGDELGDMSFSAFAVGINAQLSLRYLGYMHSMCADSASAVASALNTVTEACSTHCTGSWCAAMAGRPRIEACADGTTALGRRTSLQRAT